ncbi:MAG: L-aspartate oxidase [Fibrobacter sp.]|nr:L-aspartate oxidase [Fibrobacter sp.]
MYDILIIGAGVSGLSAALAAAEKGFSVLILTKGSRPDGSSNYAQGGIATVSSPKDSFQLHINDTLEAGDGLCKKGQVAILTKNGPATIRELVKWGVQFTASHKNETDGIPFDLHLEGGHSCKRILHAADLTGKEMMRALLLQVKKEKNIEFLENRFVKDLIISKRGAGTHCDGAVVIHQKTGKVSAIYAKSTILATGGAGRLWLHTTNPADSTGDGMAVAARAGVALQDIEFMQFHPTSLYAPELKKSFLISEAVRGFGGILKNHAGEEFMNGVHPLRSLAPRDIVARAIQREMVRTGKPNMFLDITAKPAKDIKTYFPNIFAKCLEAGIDITKEWIPVVPSAHYMCGGVLVDSWSRTRIPGLYACGEVAATGVHGANRLASNSLLESVVFALRAVKDIAKHPTPNFTPQKITLEDVSVSGGEIWKKKKLELRKMMWEHCGIVRTTKSLETGLEQIKILEKECLEALRKPGKKTLALLEFQNAVQNSRMIIENALRRKESRGLHCIINYPNHSKTTKHYNAFLKAPLKK